MSRKILLLTLPFAALACTVAPSDPASSSSANMTTDWFASNAPPGSPAEANILALVNDRSWSQDKYVSVCNFSETQAAEIVNFRNGDEPASTADDRTFHALSELDFLPFTDSAFWAAAIACGAAHPTTCVPGSHPTIVIEFVLDESGSMIGDKWAALHDAFLATVKDVAAQQDPNVLVGALGFDDTVVSKVAPGALTDSGQYLDLTSFLGPNPNGGGTGISVALHAGYDAAARAAIHDPNARRAVVLLTDGSPSGGMSEQAEVAQLTADKFKSGIDLFAVGIGEFPSSDSFSYDPAFMSTLALSGGTAPVGCDGTVTDAANLCYFQITPGADTSAMKQSLLGALGAIRTAAVKPTTCP